MYYLVCQFISVLFLISVVTLFIGWWTYADFYTKINEKYIITIWMSSLIITFFSAYFGILGLMFKPLDDALKLSVHIMGSAILFEFGIGCTYFMIIGFLKSRRYFGRKRNKI